MVAPLRVGIVGVGWGALVHGPAFGLVDGYEVVAVCGRTPSRVEEAGVRLGVADTSLDWRPFVRRDDLDVISIATPAASHAQIAAAALVAGKHVVCEKPFGVEVADAEVLCALAEQKGLATAVCYELRWLQERAHVADLVEAGFVGHPYFIRLAETAPWAHPSHPATAPWMHRLDQGGGYLNNMLSHDIDFVCHLFGKARSVCADVTRAVSTSSLRGGTTIDADADDNAVLIVRLVSGATALISMSTVSRHERRCHFEVFGEAGTVSFERGAEQQGRVAGSGSEGAAPQLGDQRQPRSGRPPPQRRSAPLVRAMALLLEDWLPAFEGLPTRVPTFRDGARVLKVIAAARQSSEGAGWVDLDDRSRPTARSHTEGAS